MSTIQINGVDPPAGGELYGKGYWFHQPPPTGTDGHSRPCGAVGKPWIEVRYEFCEQVVWNWWAAKTGTALSTGITSVRLWDDFKSGGAGYVEYNGSGILLYRPTYENISVGLYYGVRIIITNVS